VPFVHLFDRVLHGFSIVDRLWKFECFLFLNFYHRAAFSLPSRVLAGLETPRTTTVPSSAFLFGAGSFKQETVYILTIQYNTRFIAPLHQDYCFIDVADSTIPTIIDTDTIPRASLHTFNLSALRLGVFQYIVDATDILSISKHLFLVVVSTQLNGAHDVFAASCDDGTATETRDFHVEQ
jgi:hypothetical protein